MRRFPFVFFDAQGSLFHGQASVGRLPWLPSQLWNINAWQACKHAPLHEHARHQARVTAHKTQQMQKGCGVCVHGTLLLSIKPSLPALFATMLMLLINTGKFTPLPVQSGHLV